MRKLKEHAPLIFMTLGFFYCMVYFRILEQDSYERNEFIKNDGPWRLFGSVDGGDVNEDDYQHASIYLVEPENFTQASNCTDWKRDSYQITHICSSGTGESNDVILTLFTSMIDYYEDQAVFQNTLRLHSQLKPHVQPVLFVPSPALDSVLVQEACQLGWHVLTAPQCDGLKVNVHRAMLPVLKHMFLVAQEIQQSIYYGFANGDILFDDSIVSTLEALQPVMDYFPRHLFVGKKVNLKIRDQYIKTIDQLRPLAEQMATDGWVADVDYFISTNNGYPWADIPKVIIGRDGYDNWLIRNSEKIGIPVIDISSTTLAIRQVGGYKPQIPDDDIDINIRITGGFDYTKGLISCAPFKTMSDSRKDIVLVHRVKSGMCGPDDWKRRKEDMYGTDIEEPFSINPHNSEEEEETFLANLTRKIPPVEPSQYFVNEDHLELVPNCTYWNVTDFKVTKICSPVEKDNVLVTLFTTMHDSTKNHYLYENVIYLHSWLQPRVQPMLFVSSPKIEEHLVKSACALGWYVLTAPTCDRNKLPVLKNMFLAAQQVQKSTFYGYANGDIIFDESLVKTLSHIETIKQYFEQALFVGSRTNVKLLPKQIIPDLDNLRLLATKKGTDGWVAAVDYFITTRDGFPWASVPKVVVGRVGYDNWMVKTAIKNRMFAADISNTTLSVHQVGQMGYYSSHARRDANANLKFLGRLDFTQGLISCTRLKTVQTSQGTVKIMRRVKVGMCGKGHWGMRRNPEFGPYGNEHLEDFDPVKGLPTKRPEK